MAYWRQTVHELFGDYFLAERGVISYLYSDKNKKRFRKNHSNKEKRTDFKNRFYLYKRPLATY